MQRTWSLGRMPTTSIERRVAAYSLALSIPGSTKHELLLRYLHTTDLNSTPRPVPPPSPNVAVRQ
jgi:hypothetical protein